MFETRITRLLGIKYPIIHKAEEIIKKQLAPLVG